MEKSKSKKFKLSEGSQFYLYIMPWIVGFAAFTVIPMVISFILSFTNAKVSTLMLRPIKNLGFLNYKELFTLDDMFLRSIGNTFIYAIFKVLVGLIFSFLLAVLLNRNIKGKGVFRTLIYLPALIPVVGSTLLWKLIFFQDRSIMVYLCEALGMGKLEFYSQGLAMPTAIFVNVWNSVGPNMIIFLAALQGVSTEQLEAAELDGAGAFRKLISIILPAVSPTMFFVSLTGFIGALQAYAEIELLVGGTKSTFTMSMAVMSNAFSGIGMGYACAQAWVIFVIIMVFTLIYFWASKRQVHYDE